MGKCVIDVYVSILNMGLEILILLTNGVVIVVDMLAIVGGISALTVDLGCLT
jgi:hypothetical protein